MIGCIIEIYLFQYIPVLESMINDLLPTPYSPLHLIYIHRVSHDHETVDILKHIFNIPVIHLNYLIRTNLSYEWISKYKYTIIFSCNKRDINPHDFASLDIQTDLVSKHRLHVLVAIFSHTYTFEMRSITRELVVIDNISFETIIKENL